MSSGSPAAFSSPRSGDGTSSSRRRRAVLPVGRSIYEWTTLFLLGLASMAGMWLFGGVELWSVGPLMIGVFIAGALYFARPLFFPGAVTSCWPPATVGLLVFLLYAGLRVPSAGSSYVAHLTVMDVASVLLAFFVWCGLAGEAGRWRWLLGAIFLSVSLMAWYAIIQEANGSNAVLNAMRPESYGMRASGAYICPNHFANLLAMTLAMTVAIVAMPAAGYALRILAGYTALVCLPPLYLSGSRSAWIGFAAGMVVVSGLLGLRRGIRRALLLLLVALAALLVVGLLAWFFLPLVQERILDALKQNVRINLWRDTLTMIAAHPLWGTGPGSFRWVYPHYWHHLKIYIDPEFAHNEYLQLAAELGIAGLLLMVATLGWLVVRLIRLIRQGDTERGDYLIAGFVGAFAASAVHAVFDFNFHIYANAQVLAAFGGITISVLYMGRHLSPARWAVALGTARWAGLWIAIVLVPLFFTARAFVSNHYVVRGSALSRDAQMDDAIASYRRAIRIAPSNGAAHRGLGQALSAQAFWNLDREAKSAQATEALAALQRALTLNPWDAEALFGVSRAYNTLGDQEQALASLRDLLERVPHHKGYGLELGLQLRTMQKYEEALDVFKQYRTSENHQQVDLNIRFLQRKLATP